MEHQPFKNWLLDEELLSREQQKELDAHLVICPECAGLKRRLDGVVHQMQTAPLVAPPSGFSQRWKASLEERKIQSQQRHIRRLLIFFIIGALVTFFSMMVYTVINTSPADLIVTVVQTFTNLFLQWDNVKMSMLSLLQSVPLVIPLALWITLTTLLAILSVVWVAALWRISTQGVHSK